MLARSATQKSQILIGGLIFLIAASQLTLSSAGEPSNNQPSTTTSPLAAAAAALGGSLVGPAALSAIESSWPASSASVAGETQLVAHKHSAKRISVEDKLHKFDLYIDPICEQIAKLSEKQLNRVNVQMKLFSAKVSLGHPMASRPPISSLPVN